MAIRMIYDMILIVHIYFFYIYISYILCCSMERSGGLLLLAWVPEAKTAGKQNRDQNPRYVDLGSMTQRFSNCMELQDTFDLHWLRIHIYKNVFNRQKQRPFNIDFPGGTLVSMSQPGQVELKSTSRSWLQQIQEAG